MKYFLLFLLFSNSIWALDPNEEFPLKIEKVIKPDTLIINRGREDGLKKGDHLKIFKEGNYTTRAIVLKTEMGKSYLKVYRVMEVLMQGDANLELFSINRSEVPDYVTRTIASDETVLEDRLKN
ncbi:MAG: hypothetical protein ACOYL6_04575 [Bacteriovoracaceae bacterium]